MPPKLWRGLSCHGTDRRAKPDLDHTSSKPVDLCGRDARTTKVPAMATKNRLPFSWEAVLNS